MTGGGVLANRALGATISDVSVSGVLNADRDNSGGLIGESNAQISNSTSSVIINGDNFSNIGGLVGLSTGLVENSYATGDVTGATNVGGLVGKANDDDGIFNSYASGKVIALGDDALIGQNAGGLVGFAYYSTISSSVAKGNVTAEGNTLGGGQNAGGLVGKAWGDIT